MEYSSLAAAHLSIPVMIQVALRKKHSEPHRFYHTLTHILHMTKEAISIEEHISDKLAVLLAILSHDCVYYTDHRYQYNEIESAEFLRSLIFRISEEFYNDHRDSIEFAVQLIMMTKDHSIPTGLSINQQSDAALFLDLDLLILSTDSYTYAQFEKNVRQEFAHVPDEIFNLKRKEVLMHLLDSQIYKSKIFESKIDWAKQNLIQAIGNLS